MRRCIVVGCVCGLSAVVACSSSSGGSGGPDAGGQETSVQPDASGGDGGGDAAPDATACNGSVIPSTIASSMTLTAACSPWHLTGPSEVGDPNRPTAAPVLTIEPGVTILADSGAVLQVGVSAYNQGGLVAVGTTSAPIVFTSSAATPTAGAWVGVVLGDKVLATSRLTNVEIDYAGATNGSSVSAALAIGEDTGQAIALPLSNVKAAHDRGYGILLDGPQVRLGSGSAGLTVTDWGSGFAPIALAANQADSLTGVSFSTGATGHDGQIMLVDAATDPQLVNRTQTWPPIAVPYLVQGAGIDIEAPGAGNGGGQTTLTIAGPNTVMFTNQTNGGATGIYVDILSNGGANLVAANVTFTSSNTANPTAGSWGGISFNMTTAGLGNSSLTGCTFAHAGAGTNWSTGESCTGVVLIDDRSNPNTTIAGPTISGCTFQGYLGDAIFVALPTTGGLTTSYASNTFASSSTGVCTCQNGTCM